MIDESSTTRVDVLGRVSITGPAGSQEITPRTTKGVVLSMLAARSNERIGADELAEAVWPAGPPPSHRKALHVTILRLRGLFEPARSSTARSSPIIGHSSAYELRLEREQIDAGRFDRLVRDGQLLLTEGRPGAASDVLQRALRMWGEPFAGLDVEALRPAAERLRLAQRAAATAAREADLLLGRERLDDLERAVDDDPLDERRWGHLMIGLFRRGRQADALTTFQRARRTLIDEVGVEPGQYLRRVEQQVLLQDTGLLAAPSADVAAVAATAQPWPRPPNLRGPLLLRDDELRAAHAQLGRWRAVTLCGPPGVGKTSLATAVAESYGTSDVAWVALGDVARGPGALFDLTTRLGIITELGAEATEHVTTLTARIADHQLLLVLDNVEHVIEVVADVAAALLRTCPNVTLLLTSRRPVGFDGEHVKRLEPFGVDGAHSAATYLATRIGQDRLDEVDEAALVRIGAHVGGLALGLEQAAACLQTMDPKELADRLDLLDAHRDGDALGKAIGSSLALLDPHVVELLQALAHLDGGWPLARAEGIGRRLGSSPTAVAGAVQALLESSLVVESPAGPAGRSRRIIEPVRQHVRAECAHTADPRRFPAACAATVAEEVGHAARLVEGLDQRAGIDLLRSLMPDIRGTVAWGVANGEAAVLADVLAPLRSWWFASGMFADGQVLHQQADPVIDAWRPSSVAERSQRLRALSAGVVTRVGFAAPAVRAASLRTWLDEADEIGADPDVRSWLAQLLSAGLTFTNRQPEAAESLAHTAIAAAREAHSPWLEAFGRYALAIARARVDPVDGLARFEEAVSAFEAAGDRLNAARVLMFLGHGIRIFGDGRSSDAAFAKAEEWCAQVGAAPVTQLDCELGRAQGADTAGDVDEAAARYRRVIPKLWELGDYRCAAIAQRNLAAIVAAGGDLDAASALASRALDTFRRLETEEAELAATELVRAEIAAGRGQWTLVSRLVAEATALAGGSGVPLELRDHARLDALRASAGQHAEEARR